jgi:uncharacterized protein (DUF2141 family)
MLLLSAAGEPTGATLEVSVTQLRNGTGKVGCMLFTGPEGFPEDAARAYRTARVDIREQKATCRFEGLPPGEYAVIALHDENGNEKMEKGFLGIPKEGYGPSNNHTHALSSPTWDESRFVVKPGAEATLTITLKY